MSSSSLSRQSNPPDEVLSPSSATAPAVKAEPIAENPSKVLCTSTSTVRLTPDQLVSLAYSGHFQKQGISSYGALISAIDGREITAKDLVESAVKANQLSPQILTNQGYLEAVKNEMHNQLKTH